MKRLNSRQLYIPNGFQFSIAEIGYRSHPWASFDGICNAVMQIVVSNPQAAAQYKWPTTRTGVEDWVEAAQVAICERNGWTSYVNIDAPEPPPPKRKALLPLDQKQISAVADKAKKVWQGVKSLNDWIDSEEPPVESEKSAARARTCATCPKNGGGGMEEWFTKPASEAIRRQFEKLSHRKLSTPDDATLGVCMACLCPLKLLVHTPLRYKLAHMDQATRAALDPGCWVISEEKQLNAK